jgi:hypothetical protein
MFTLDNLKNDLNLGDKINLRYKTDYSKDSWCVTGGYIVYWNPNFIALSSHDPNNPFIPFSRNAIEVSRDSGIIEISKILEYQKIKDSSWKPAVKEAS